MPNKYTEQDYIDKCKSLNLTYVGNHKEPKKGTIIEFVCPKHNDKGIQYKDWSHFKDYSYGCSYCTGRGKTNDDIYKEIKNKDVILISRYTGNENPIRCKCKTCGYEWVTLPKSLTTNGSGCPVCGRIKAGKSRMKRHEKFVEEIKQIDSDIEVLDKYRGSHTKIKFKCKKCNTIWEGYPSNLLNRSTGCPNCNMSVGEKSLLHALDLLGIDYISQYRIFDGVHKKPLRFDAFNISHKVAFEFNGEQHYRPVDFAGYGEEWANHQFKLTQERDESKRNYCKEKEIQLIEIPYWEKNNLISYIQNKWKELSINIA